MHPDIEGFYLSKPEPTRSCLFALRDLILSQDKQLAEAWKYSMPFFCINKKMACYLWVDKKTLHPYIGIVEGKKISHPRLIQEKRARMKIMLFNPEKDLPVKTIRQVLKEMIALYK